MDEYIKKYKTGDSGIVWTKNLFIISLVTVAITVFINIPGIMTLPIMFSFLFGGFYFISLRGYRELVLYKDRLEMTSLFDSQIYQIEFSTIKHMGFLTESIGSGNVYVNTDLEGNKLKSLIFLLYDGEKIELDGSDFDHLHEVYAFIQERTNL